MAFALAPLAIGAGIGALGGLMGRDSNQSISTSSNQNSRGQSTWAPHAQTQPAYGGMLDTINRMGQTPTPFFPGQTYVGPSAATQQGVNMGMSSMPYYQQGAQGLQAAGGQYGQAGAMAPGVANSYNAAGAMAPGVANQYGQAGNAYGGAAGLYGNAAGGLLGARGAYGDAGQAFGAAVPGQLGALGTAMGNYGMLSNAADVANNPYVSGMADTIQSRMNRNLQDQIAGINSGAANVSAMGGSRHGALQGKAVGDTNQAIGENLANLYGNAYGQGLGAQQNALGQLGNMQAGFARPGETLARRADMGTTAAQLGLQAANAGAQGAGMMENRAGMGLQGMNAMGQGAGYNQQAMDAMGSGAGYTQRGGQAVGAAGDMINQGAQNALNYGQVAEGYQGRALADAMARHQYQYQEPWQRMNMVSNALGAFNPMGTGNTSGAGSGTGTMPNPQYQSPGQALMGGALAGAGMTSGLWGGR